MLDFCCLEIHSDSNTNPSLHLLADTESLDQANLLKIQWIQDLRFKISQNIVSTAWHDPSTRRRNMSVTFRGTKESLGLHLGLAGLYSLASSSLGRESFLICPPPKSSTGVITTHSQRWEGEPERDFTSISHYRVHISALIPESVCLPLLVFTPKSPKSYYWYKDFLCKSLFCGCIGTKGC